MRTASQRDGDGVRSTSTVNYDLIVSGRTRRIDRHIGPQLLGLAAGSPGDGQIFYLRDIGVIPDRLNQRGWRGL